MLQNEVQQLIDPIIALAYSLYSSKGVYALLLGSGVSRSAGIPTGWEVVLDLIEKLAVLEEREAPLDPSGWYRDKYGEEADYSKLLTALAKSPTERQQVLATYFEPTEEDLEQGLKIPTPGHRAIASLVASGYIKILVTTNFDRLIEKALEEKGITPVVLSTADAIHGSKPLVHQDCVVVKVHGDYLDTRIKNSPEELETYDLELNTLLDQIADEYGLIICGWSAEWDAALRVVLERAPNRRFPMYWASRSTPTGKAKQLVDSREAIVIPISDSDQFFEQLSQRVHGLQDFNSSHPLSVAAATSIVKRYLSAPKYRIKLHDLVRQETETAFLNLQAQFDAKTYNTDLRLALTRYSETIETLRAISNNIAYFDGDSHGHVRHSVIRLTQDPKEAESGSKINFALRALPSLTLFYSSGIAACAGNHIKQICTIAQAPIRRQFQKDEPFLTALEWTSLPNTFSNLMPGTNGYFQTSKWLSQDCRSSLLALIPDEPSFDYQFDRFEAVVSLIFLALDKRTKEGASSWAPLGQFAYKHANGRSQILEQITEDQAVVDALVESRIYLSKQAVHQGRDALREMISRRNLW